MKSEGKGKLLDYSLKLLSIRPRSVRELTSRLVLFSKKHKFDLDLHEKVISELIARNLLNDIEFVKWWLDQRREFKPKGKRLIELELINKGIDKETIKSIFDEVPVGDELESARKVIMKKNRIWKNLEPGQYRKKISISLQSKGFSWGIISQVIDSINKKA